jgi:hypothetical protein
MHATGNINININNRWLHQGGVELWVYLLDVTIGPGNNCDINIVCMMILGLLSID